MPRFNTPIISAVDIIKQLHKSMYYQDIDAIMLLWLDEDQISYINTAGNLYTSFKNIQQAFAKNIEKSMYTEIVQIKTHTLMGCVFVESLEAIKEGANIGSVIAYQNVTYVLVQNHLGLRFMRIHSSTAHVEDVALIEFDLLSCNHIH